MEGALESVMQGDAGEPEDNSDEKYNYEDDEDDNDEDEEGEDDGVLDSAYTQRPY